MRAFDREKLKSAIQGSPLCAPTKASMPTPLIITQGHNPPINHRDGISCILHKRYSQILLKPKLHDLEVARSKPPL